MSTRRELTRADLLSAAEYAARRRDLRHQMAGLKRRRRLEIGPYATMHFENFETMRHQVQEMLYIEKGGEAQIADELAAYNPLVPQGNELIATAMFEIEDQARRERLLHRLGGIEHHAFLDIDGRRVRAEPDPSRENTSPEGKASAVQFLRFALDPAAIARFKMPGMRILAGFDHPNYGHLAMLPEDMRIALAENLA